jgi:hypothetical protein
MVLPIRDQDGNFVKDNGAVVFTEQERSPILDRPPVKKLN